MMGDASNIACVDAAKTKTDRSGMGPLKHSKR